MSKLMFKPSLESQLLEKELIPLVKDLNNIDRVYTYEELSEWAGIDIQKNRHIFYATRRRLLSQHNIVMECIPEVGYKRLTSTEIVDASNRDLVGIKRSSYRAGTKLAKVEFDSLTPEYKALHNQKMSIFQLFRFLARPRQQNQLLEKVKEKQKRLDLKGTLKLFGVQLEGGEEE